MPGYTSITVHINHKHEDYQMDTTKPMSFVMAMREFFGRKDGQSLTEFAAELKTLNDAEKAFFIAGLKEAGFNIAQ